MCSLEVVLERGGAPVDLVLGAEVGVVFVVGHRDEVVVFGLFFLIEALIDSRSTVAPA